MKRIFIIFFIPLLGFSQEVSIGGNTATTSIAGTALSRSALSFIDPLEQELYTDNNALARGIYEADGTLGITEVGVTLQSIESSPSPEDGTSLLEISSTDQNSDRAEIDLSLPAGLTFVFKYYAWEESGGNGRTTSWTGFNNFAAHDYTETRTEYIDTLTTNSSSQKVRFYNFGIPKVYVDGLSIKQIILPEPDGDIALNTLKGFPSLQGYNADIITGGRGGKIFFVTSLADTNTGSYDAGTDTYSGTFRYACEHAQAGYIIFRLSGQINTGAADYACSNKTVLGGTAPFPGIVFYGNSFEIADGEHNNIIRGITFLGGTTMPKGAADAFSQVDGSRLALSDNTFGYGGDEAASTRAVAPVIFQRNFNIEGHPEHNVGGIVSTGTTPTRPREYTNMNASIHDEVYVHISHRFKNVQGYASDSIEVINQVAYNLNLQFTSDKYQAKMIFRGNYAKAGPRTSNASERPNFRWNADNECDCILWDPPPSINSGQNIFTNRSMTPIEDDQYLWNQHITANGYISNESLPPPWFTPSYNLGIDMVEKTAAAAYTYNVVGKNVGSRYYINSSGVRVKYIIPEIENYFTDIINGTDTFFKNSQAAFVAPTLGTSGAAYTDNDNDGMGDVWEAEVGFNPAVSDFDAVPATITVDGVIWINNAGYQGIDFWNDYVHGGFLWIINQQ